MIKKRGLFIVLVGIDGSGKSSILGSLKENGINVLDWKDIRSYEEVAYLAPPKPREIRSKLKPMSRAMFVASHLVAEYEYLIQPLVENGQNVLIDSYFYKWVAKESIYKKTHNIFFVICDLLPKPDLVILLDLPPEIAFERKSGDLSPFEYFLEPTIEDFSNFQSQVVSIILEKAKNVPIKRVNAEQEVELVKKEILQLIEIFDHS